MQLASYRHGDRTSFGVVTGGGIVDGAALGPGWTSLRTVLASEGGLSDLAELSQGRAPDVALEAVELLPPVPEPAKIVCAGSNYQAHRDESISDLPPVPEYPTIFTRFPDSVSGHGATITSPTAELDFEGEIAVVIGTSGYRVPAEETLALVAGYGPFNDFSVRDWQRHSSQWCPGKNAVGVGSFGPWITTVDDPAELADVTLTTTVNGVQRQAARMGEMVFGLTDLLAYITAFTPLHPGDVVVTGTPGGVGVGQRPPVYLADGDVVEVSVSGVGTLSNAVRIA